MSAMGGGQHHHGIPDLLGRFANMQINGSQAPKNGQDKEKPKSSPPSAKPGTIMSYEGYTFDQLKGWEVASKRVIRVSEDDIEAKVASKKGQGSIIDTMGKMSSGRRAQIDRLIEEKNRDEKEPQWFEWTPVALEDGKSRTNRRGSKSIKEVFSMDVFIARKVRKNLHGQKSEKPKDDKGKPSGVLGGTIVDVRQPLKPKEASIPKDILAHQHGLPQLGHVGHDHEPLGGMMNGHGGGHQGGMMGGHGGGPFPGHGGGNHGGELPMHVGGNHGGGLPMHGGGHPVEAAGHGVVQLGGGGDGHGGGHGAQVGHGGHGRRRSRSRRASGPKNQPDIKVMQDDVPVKGGAPAGMQGGHGHQDLFSAPIPTLPHGVADIGKNPSGFIPDPEGSSLDEDDNFSIFDEDEHSSATSMFSTEVEKPLPRRGSLKLSRRRSKGGDPKVYREHRREKNYRDPQRRRESRYEGEPFDMYLERSGRPPVERRSTIAYPANPRRITSGESPPLSLRGHSPVRRQSVLIYPDELDRYRAKERDAEEYLRRRDEEEDMRRIQLARERDRARRAYEDDILERMTLRSDPTGRYRYRYRD